MNRPRLPARSRGPRANPPKLVVPDVPKHGWMIAADFFKRWGLYRDSLDTLTRRGILKSGGKYWRVVDERALLEYSRKLMRLRIMRRHS